MRLVQLKDIFVVTRKDYRNIVREQLPGIQEQNIICEPIGHNTAHYTLVYEPSILRKIRVCFNACSTIRSFD